jgi:hypothetical protein
MCCDPIFLGLFDFVSHEASRTHCVHYPRRSEFTFPLSYPRFATLLPLQFHRDVPPLHHFQLFRMPMTDKTFTYLLGLHLLLFDPPGSVYASICGMLAGFLYSKEDFGLRLLRLPSWLEACCRLVVWPLVEPAALLRRAGGAEMTARVGGAGAWLRRRDAQLQQQRVWQARRPAQPARPRLACPRAERGIEGTGL